MNSGSHPIEFHVWQADETLSNVYHLVGINIFQDAQPDDNRLIGFPEEKITVIPGDFVGVRTVEQPGSPNDEGFAIQFDKGDSETHWWYFCSDENFPTPAVLDLRLPDTNFSSLKLTSFLPASL